MKRLSIFGSSGFIGRKALEIAKSNGFKIIAITGHGNHDEIIKQALSTRPKYVCVTDINSFRIVSDALSTEDIEILPQEELCSVASIDVDCCVMAIAGNAGLAPTFATLGKAKRLAIATKEAVISGGNLLMNSAKNAGTEIITLDSEHNAILQCLLGEEKKNIAEIILTASGGAFLDFEEKDLKSVTPNQAIKHPNWSMGKKITIDSSTLINKAIEIIEAAYLFDFEIARITPVIHPESMIHGMVKFNDNSFKAAISYPDMRLPISFAINYPNRNDCNLQTLDFETIKTLSFRRPKDWQLRNINLGYRAFNEQKVIAFNTFNELAVYDFLREKLAFTDIYRKISSMLESANAETITSVDDILEVITETKKIYKASQT